VCRERIDVDEIVQSIGYKDTKDFLEKEYVNTSKGFAPLAEWLGIVPQTLATRARQLGIKIKPKGGPNNTQCISKCYELLKTIDTSNYSIAELSNRTGYDYTTIAIQVHRHNLSFKRDVRPPLKPILEKLPTERMTIKDIMNALPDKYRQQTVANAMRRYNMQWRKKNGMPNVQRG